MFPFIISELKVLNFSALLGIFFLSSNLVNEVINYLNNYLDISNSNKEFKLLELITSRRSSARLSITYVEPHRTFISRALFVETTTEPKIILGKLTNL